MYSMNETLRAIGRVMARYAQDTAGGMDADGVIEAAPLMKPWMAGTMEMPVFYIEGDVRTHEGQPWRCSQAHVHYGETGWDPASSRALWAPYHATKQEYALPYVEPTHAEDSYQTGEWMIWTDGKRYQALRDAVDRGPDVLADAWEVEKVVPD